MHPPVLLVTAVLVLTTAAHAQNLNQITSVAPDGAPAGTTGLVVTFGLDTDVPPAPPAGILPTSVTIGTYVGTALTHASQHVVTATFALPADAMAGARDVAVTFQTPNGTLVFSLAAGFTITAGGDQPPTVTSHPQPVTTVPGGSATFTVAAGGSPPLSYQWQHDNADLAGADGTVLTLSDIDAAAAGDYACVVTNDFGSAISDAATLTVSSAMIGAHPVVDTGQDTCFDLQQPIDCPSLGQPLHGQDAQHAGHQPGFTLGTGGLTVHDDVTGLDWQRSADIDGDADIDVDDKLTWSGLQAYPAALNAQTFGGHDDWRLPTIAELYSLIDFRGLDPSGDESELVPFLDTDAFAFAYGDEAAGERLIDAQYGSSTLYVSQAAGTLLFGVNFADGRIKGYGLAAPGGGEKAFFVKCVRGNPLYAASVPIDNGDGTVSDLATGLMWSRDDSGVGMNWTQALAWVAARNAENHLGHDDWRLPNAKELQSLVDYTRSPDTTGSAAIAPVFDATSITNEAGQPDFPFYWASTTHAASGPVEAGYAVYVAFGRALGYMNGGWVDVHGAGAQRSDPKDGDPDDYPYGHGPQGDAIRIFNFVRLVRDVVTSTHGAGDLPPAGSGLNLRAAPNPFNPSVAIRFDVPVAGRVSLRIHDVAGRHVATLLDEVRDATSVAVRWNGTDEMGRAVASGVYFARVAAPAGAEAIKLVLAR